MPYYGTDSDVDSGFSGGIQMVDVTVLVQDENGDPVYGAQLEYYHPRYKAVRGLDRFLEVVRQSAPEIEFDALKQGGEIIGTIQITLGSYTLYDGPASDIIQGRGDSYEATVISQLATPADFSSDNTILLSVTPTASSVPGGLLIRWQDMGSFLYRVYASEDASRVMNSPAGATFDEYYLLQGVPDGATVYVVVQIENKNGTSSRSTTAEAFTYEQVQSVQGFVRHKMPRSLELAAGESLTLDLTEYAVPTQLTGESSSLATRWSNTTIGVYAHHGGTPLSLDLVGDGTQLMVTALNGAESGSVSYIGIQLDRDACGPMWFGFVVTIEPSSSALGGYNLGLTHADNHPNGLLLDFETLVGTDVELMSIDDWAITRVANLRPLGLDESGVNSSNVRDGVPGIAVFRGDDGWGSVTLATDPGVAITETSYLPDVPDQVETASSWQTYTQSTFLQSQGALGNASWRRCLVGTTLYDLSTTAPPVEVYYEAPQIFNSIWWDAAQYPADATYLPHKVVYRGGLETEEATPTLPSISAASAQVTGPSTVLLSWATANPYDATTITAPISVYARRATGDPLIRNASGSIELTGLLSGTAYTVRFGEDTESAPEISFTTADDRVLVTLNAVALDDNKYQYTYTLNDDALDNKLIGWIDPWQTHHTSKSVTVEDDQQLLSHALRVFHTGHEYVLTAAPRWQMPPAATALETDAVIGRVLPANQAPAPQFGTTSYAGTASTTLPPNLYKIGTYTAVLEGMLPPGMPGELEDHTTIDFIDPTGGALGSVAVLTLPTELTIRITVTAADGLSPQVFGVRVIQQR